MADWIYADNSIEITQELPGVPVSVLKIMKRRGVAEADFEDFLSSKPKKTYDPFLLPDLEDACRRILELCSLGKSICVYGDYDADGITSTTLMYLLLSYFTDKVSYYIPSRFSDGYGPNKDAIKRIKDGGADVIITVDCGITSRAEMDYAESIGLECIVTDHHIIRDGMTPDCLIVNPHREDSKYPYSELSGCGVAFKVAQGIERLMATAGDSRFTKKELNDFLDLVAISTVADVVPLLDENRLLVKYGLDRINRRSRRGLYYLLEELSLDGIVDSSGISYVIAPNINALGRIGRCNDGVELLKSRGGETELKDIAAKIAETNRLRKAIQEQTAEICRNALEKGDCGEYAPVIYAPGAHEGVAGIVAGNLKEQLGRPVCIISPTENGTLKGTGRSVPGLNLHELFENCDGVFERFGGHAGACGFTVKEGKLDEFRSWMQYLVKTATEKNPDILKKKIYVEKELSKEEKTLEFARAISMLEPFGEANPIPLFSICDARVSDVRHLGAEGQHLKFTVCGKDGVPVSCIAFRGSIDYGNIDDGSIVDVAGELGINEFRGRKTLQLKVTDIREKA